MPTCCAILPRYLEAMGGVHEDRRWLPVRQGALLGRYRAGVCRRVPLQELSKAGGNRLQHSRGNTETGIVDAGHAEDVQRSRRQRRSRVSPFLSGMRIANPLRGRGVAESSDHQGRNARRYELAKARNGDILRQRPAVGKPGRRKTALPENASEVGGLRAPRGLVAEDAALLFGRRGRAPQLLA